MIRRMSPVVGLIVIVAAVAACTPTLAGATRVAGGYAHTCAVVTNGAIKCWGYNGAGALGNGTTTSSAVPVAVSGVTGATDVTAGEHTCALFSAGGNVSCWGPNTYGELGSANNVGSLTPKAVSGLSGPVGVTAISAGLHHTCAVVPAGKVKCWGLNQYGQLGNKTYVDSNVPVTVVDAAGAAITGVTAIAAGTYHTCARLSTGTVTCWGVESGGSPLGDLNHAAAFPGLTGVTALSAGMQFSCALVTGGTVKCWGWNTYGRLGHDATSNWVAGTVLDTTGGALTGVTSIASGLYSTCATKSDGTSWCWGFNGDGELGNGTFTDSARAKRALIGGTARTGLGLNHSCAVSTSGGVKCWGSNRSRQLGAGPILINVVTYNIANGGPTPGKQSGQDDVAADIAAHGKADIYAIQEFCSDHTEIKDALGAGYTAIYGWDATPPEQACGSTTKSFGNVLYVNTAGSVSTTTTVIRYPTNDGTTAKPKHRNLACIHTQVHAAPVLACNTHLAAGAGNQSIRLAEEQYLLSWVQANRLRDEAVIVAGDFNLTPSDGDPDWVQAWRDAGFASANTANLATNQGSSQIDYVWVSNATASTASTFLGQSSDHDALKTTVAPDLNSSPVPIPVIAA